MTTVELGSGVHAAAPAQLIEALGSLPEDCTLFKLWTTGNLAVVLDGEQIGHIDLQSGTFEDLRP